MSGRSNVDEGTNSARQQASEHPPRLVLVGGGARSGKSRFALELARRLGQRRAFVATAQALDDEMRDRITRHAAERGDAFVTVEEPLALAETLARLEGFDVVVVDCLTLWLSNLLLSDAHRPHIAARVEQLAAVLARRRPTTIVVSNEVGMGVVPDNALARQFRDVVGHAHQRLAAGADQIYFAVLGSILRIAPAPVVVCPEGLA